MVHHANAYREGLSPLARQMIANRPGVPGAKKETSGGSWSCP